MQSGPTTPADAPPPEAGVLRLRDPRHRVHRRSILWWTLHTSTVWLVPIVGQILGLVFGGGSAGWLGVTLTVSIVLAVLQGIIEPQWRYRVHRWEATPESVVTRSGWLNQEWRIAPVSRIQTVDTKRGPLEQLLGLATVTVTTASAAGPLHIAGLAYEDAMRLVDELTVTTQATPGDAT